MAVTRLQKELLHEPPSAAPVKMERDSRAKQSGAKAEAAGGPQRVPWLGVLFTLCWMTASAALIFINKQLMVDEGFRFPFALTSLGQLSSAVLGAAGQAGGGARAEPASHAAALNLAALLAWRHHAPTVLCPPPCCAAWVATRVGLTPLLPPPSLAYTVRNLLPVSASFALVLFLGNVAYLGLSGEECGGGCREARSVCGPANPA